MKIWDIVRTVGSKALQVALPGVGSTIVAGVNALLPSDKKLPDNATGDDIASAISSLPPEQQAQVLNKEFDVDITQIKESNETLRAMLESDTKNPHTTRPYIAKHSFHVIAFAVMTCVSMWAYAVLIRDKTLVIAIMDGWGFIASVLTPLVLLLWAYFGILKQEHKNKLNAASGSPSMGIVGTLAKLIRK